MQLCEMSEITSQDIFFKRNQFCF